MRAKHTTKTSGVNVLCLENVVMLIDGTGLRQKERKRRRKNECPLCQDYTVLLHVFVGCRYVSDRIKGLNYRVQEG